MATDLRWLDGVVGSWFIAGNWAPAQVPTAGDTATIGSGTAIVSGTGSVTVLGEAIILDSAGDNTVATLHAVNAQFAGSGSGASELNATLTVSGTYNERTRAVFIAEGDTSFDGQIFVQATAGSLTIHSVANGSDAGTFTLLNTDDKATIIVSQESFLDFEGQFFVNQGVIEIEGTAEISAGVVFSGADGVFVLENGGRLIVEGAVSADQQIIFFDGTGKLFIENIADFHAVIGFAELPPAPGQPALGIAGGRIYIEGIEAQSMNFVLGSDGRGVLNLYAGSTPTGQPIAQLTMEMVASQLEPVSASSLSTADFILGSDGNGGTLITYAPQGSTYLLASLPKPVIADPNEVIPLTSILLDSFGTSDTPFEGVWLFPSKKYINTKDDVGYWSLDPDEQVTPTWYIGNQKVEKATYVTDISNVTLHAGNQIDSPLSFLVDPVDREWTQIHSQSAQFTHAVGLTSVWQALGIAPDVTLGHSLGEIAAAYVAGAMTLGEAVAVVIARAGALDGLAGDFGAASLGVSIDEAQQAVSDAAGWMELSVVNSAASVVVSGDRSSVAELVSDMQSRGRFARVIAMSFPAHTSALDPLRTQLLASLATRAPEAEFRSGTVPFIGSVTGQAVDAGTEFGDYWYRNLRNTVRFDRAAVTTRDSGVEAFIEMSAHPALLHALADTAASGASDRAGAPLIVGSGRRDEALADVLSDNIATVAVADPTYDWAGHVEPNQPMLRRFPPAPMAAIHLWAAPEPLPPVTALTVGAEHWQPQPEETVPLIIRRAAVLELAGPRAELGDRLRDGVRANLGTLLVEPADADLLIVVAPMLDHPDTEAAIRDLAERHWNGEGFRDRYRRA